MIRTRLSLYGTEQSVVRQVYITVIEDIKEMLGSKHDIFTTYDEEDLLNRQKDKIGQVRDKTTVAQESIMATLEEAPEDNLGVYRHTIKPTYRPIYVDNSINNKIIPIYQRTKATISFKYSSKSKSKINALVSKLHLMSVNEEYYKTHELEYSYTINDFIIRLMKNVNDLKNNYDIPALELEEYINNTFDKRVDIVNAINGDINKSTLVVREKQVGVIGYIADDTYDIQKDKEDDNYSVTFAYEWYYEKPVALELNYNILVYNQLLDSVFLNFSKENNLREELEHVNSDPYVVFNNLSMSNRQTLKTHYKDNEYIPIPPIDTVKLPPVTSFMKRVVSLLVIVDKDDKKKLFNLRTNKSFNLKDGVIDMLVGSEREYIGELSKSLYYFGLYEDGKPKKDNIILLDVDGNLRTTYDMDITKTYRVDFSMVTDVSYLSPENKNRILNSLKEQSYRNKFNTETELQNVQFKLDPDETKFTMDATKYKLNVSLDQLSKSEITMVLYKDDKPTDIKMSVNDDFIITSESDLEQDVLYELKFFNNKIKDLALDSYVGLFAPTKQGVNTMVNENGITDENLTDIITIVSEYKNDKPFLFQEGYTLVELIKE